MGYITITPAAIAVSVADIKLNSRIENTVEDAWITDAIKAATEQAEHRTGNTYGARVVEFALDSFPVAEIQTPTPLNSVVSIKYVNEIGNEQTVSNTLYTIENYRLKHWILPVGEWPVTSIGANAVKIQVNIGYAEMPASVKQWVKLAVDTWYKHRGSVTDAQSFELPRNFGMALLDPHMTYNL